MNRKYFVLFLSILLLFNYSMYGIWDDWSDSTKLYCKVVGTVCAFISSYSYFDHTKQLSHEQEWRVCRQQFEDTHDLYADVCTAFENTCSISYPLSYMAHKDIVQQFDETKLHNFCSIIWKMTRDIKGFTGELEKKYKKFFRTVKHIRYAMIDISKQRDEQFERALLFVEIEKLYKNIEPWMMRFSLLADFCAFHKNYFLVFHYEALFKTKYGLLLDIDEVLKSEDSLETWHKIVEKIKQMIKESDYPFWHFVQMLKQDIKILTMVTTKLTASYPSRIEAVRQLQYEFDVLRKIIEESDVYQKDVQRYNDDQSEKKEETVTEKVITKITPQKVMD